MNLIIVSQQYDLTTDYLLEWCDSSGIHVVRRNAEAFTDFSFAIDNDSNSIRLQGHAITADHVLLNRRGKINLNPKVSWNNAYVRNYFKKEANSIARSIEFNLKNAEQFFGSYEKEADNQKIKHLLNAQKAGMMVPNSLVTTNKKDLRVFYERHKPIVTKDVKSGLQFKTLQGTFVTTGTSELTQETIDGLPDHFLPIYVQEMIKKKYELRIFVFKESLYAMAIFAKDKEEIDTRESSSKNLNRSVPYNLPELLKGKIQKFMSLSGLDTGSIDIIVDQKNNFVFLEINPQGQIDWLSKNCNYYIEKNILNSIRDEKSE
ncbi:hypothetical protein [Gilvibacter sp.]|uniref:hypothetical protein n=1 Tax=Gilvibacter sp. TaxID=2729997 RepID=UPI003B51D130